MDISSVSKRLSIPEEDVSEAFGELKSKGIIFTPANSAGELSDDKLPIRLVGVPPAGGDGPSVVSCGPFPVETELYSQIKKEIPDEDTRSVLLGFARLAYEEQGGGFQGYSVQTEDDQALDEFLSWMKFWDVQDPIVKGGYTWFLPTYKCKRVVQEITEKDFEEDDYSWWNVKIEFDDSLIPKTPEDDPERYASIPDEIMKSWGRYLPKKAYISLIMLYSRGTTLKGFVSFESINTVLDAIESGIESVQEEVESASESSTADRELLIKELYDYNDFPYPTNEESIFDLFMDLGFIYTDREEGKHCYYLNKNVNKASDVIDIPPGWEDKMDKFTKTGSILFSYLEVDEVAGSV